MSDLPADLDAKIAAHLERERVDPSYRAFVLRHLRDPSDNWRFCCSSMCDPCAKQLERVVDGLRAELGIVVEPL